MSYVTDVIVVIDYASPEFQEAVTTPVDLRGEDWLDTFKPLDMDAAGGTKYVGSKVYAAGINYCDLDKLRAWADALPWSSGGLVMVAVEQSEPEVWTNRMHRPVRMSLPEPESGWFKRIIRRVPALPDTSWRR